MVLLHATHQLWVKVPFFFPPFFHCIYIWWTIKLWSNNGVVKDRDQSEGCVKVSNSFCGDMELKMLQRRKCVPVSQIIIDRNGVAAEGTRSHTSLWLGTLSFLSHKIRRFGMWLGQIILCYMQFYFAKIPILGRPKAILAITGSTKGLLMSSPIRRVFKPASNFQSSFSTGVVVYLKIF